MAEFLTTREVAAHLRLKERKIYELVRSRTIPCARVTGKLLFPRHAVDAWVMHHVEGELGDAGPAPPVYAGSHDPLLEWALRESQSELAVLCNGSGDGVQRLLAGRARLVGLHVLDASSGRYNEAASLGLVGMRDLLLIEWARRVQGLVVARGNPLAIKTIGDLQKPGVRVAYRQRGAGAATLFGYLLREAGLQPEALAFVRRPSLSEDDLALEIRDGRADSGMAVKAAARRHGLDFISLTTERFDLAMRRRDYFEAPVQRLFAFSRNAMFVERAREHGGYDIGRCGEVSYNA